MGGYVVPAASDPTVTSHAGASGAIANGLASLVYVFVLNGCLNDFMSRLDSIFRSVDGLESPFSGLPDGAADLCYPTDSEDRGLGRCCPVAFISEI
jgi:hypothetical protein